MLVSLEDFWEGGHSVCRNPLLQKMFVFVGVGEKAGSGADIISTGWRENGWQLPTLVEHQMPARVEATLLIEDLMKQQEGETTQKSGLKTENHTENGLKTTQKTESNQKTTQKTKLEHSTTQKILSLIKQKRDITRQELAEACAISSDGIKWQLKKLQEKGLIHRVGPDKGGHWEIVEP